MEKKIRFKSIYLSPRTKAFINYAAIRYDEVRVMAAINPFVHIVLGIIVTVASLLNKNMILFVAIGIGFIIWGGIRLIIASSKKKEKKQVYPAQDSAQAHAHRQHHQHGMHNSIHQHHPAQQHSHAPRQHAPQHGTHNHPVHQQQYKRCPSCHQAIERSYRFCPYCGYGV